MYWGDFDKAWLLTAVQPLNTNSPEYVQQMLEYVKRHRERPSVVFACSRFGGWAGRGKGCGSEGEEGGEAREAEQKDRM